MSRIRWGELHRLTLLCLFVGLCFSLFSTAETYDPALQSSCSVNALFSCHNVDVSDWSHLGPIPDWSIGIGGFLLMFIAEGRIVQRYEPSRVHLLLLLSLGGVAVSIFLGSVEVFIIKSVCPICLGAYLSNVAVLGCVLTMERKKPPKEYRLRSERATHPTDRTPKEEPEDEAESEEEPTDSDPGSGSEDSS
jgi:uncharacterized membrane protein